MGCGERSNVAAHDSGRMRPETGPYVSYGYTVIVALTDTVVYVASARIPIHGHTLASYRTPLYIISPRTSAVVYNTAHPRVLAP